MPWWGWLISGPMLQSAYVIETLGRYSDTLQAGLHILIPFWSDSPTVRTSVPGPNAKVDECQKTTRSSPLIAPG